MRYCILIVFLCMSSSIALAQVKRISPPRTNRTEIPLSKKDRIEIYKCRNYSHQFKEFLLKVLQTNNFDGKLLTYFNSNARINENVSGYQLVFDGSGEDATVRETRRVGAYCDCYVKSFVVLRNNTAANMVLTWEDKGFTDIVEVLGIKQTSALPPIRYRVYVRRANGVRDEIVFWTMHGNNPKCLEF